jgi:hypothetical protein
MRRRTLLKLLPALGVSAVWLEACKSNDEPKLSLQNLKLNPGDYTLIGSIINAILPAKDVNEQAAINEFALKYIDQVASKSDRNAFSEQLKSIKSILKDKGSKLDSIDTKSIRTVWGALTDEKNPSAKALELIKNAAVVRYTSREAYMTEKLSYKFVPGAYQGCVKI